MHSKMDSLGYLHNIGNMKINTNAHSCMADWNKNLRLKLAHDMVSSRERTRPK